MKKILLLIICLFLGGISVQAKTMSDTFHSIFHYKYHYVDNHGKFGDFEIIQRDKDGAYAFCIEPGMPLTEDSYQGYQQLSDEELATIVGITKKQLQDISLYAYFGYLFEDHSDSSWLVAVQSKIWQLLGREFQFTSRNKESNPYQYVIDTPFEIQQEMDALEQLKEAYYNPPKIEKFTIQLGETKVLTDFAFYDFELVTTNPNIEKKGHQITIHGNQVGTYEFKLRRRFLNYPTTYFVYHQDYGQDLFVGGNIPDIEIPIQYIVKDNEIILEKKDEQTKSCQKEFDKAIYSLYKEDGTFITEVHLKNCQARINHLPLGNYYFLEKEAPSGYELDTTKHSFEITTSKTNPIHITLLEKRIKRHLQIHKSYIDYKLHIHDEENAIFKIFKKDSLEEITTLKTDQKGNANATLEYGEYILKQISGKDNYAKIEDQVFSIQKEDITLNLENKPYTKDIVIQKKDAVSKKSIQIPNIEFELYDKVHHEKICRTQDCIFRTNNQGEITIQDLHYSTYELKELPQIIQGYTYQKEPITFTINKESKDIILLDFYNDPVQGKIQIIKKNNNNEPMPNIVFQILNQEYQPITSAQTDEHGIIDIYLNLGTYYIQEIATTQGYNLDNQIYKVVLNQENSEQNLIQKNVEIINYPIPKTFKNKNSNILVPLFLWGGLFYVKKRYFNH
ncbi:MAG: hypothetical protein IJ743_05550 [Bacilli bacterium]|nr:hypothetical protein [Bacilli bacterium]